MSCKLVETDLDEGVLNNTEWINRWAVGQTEFHESKHAKILEEKEKEIFGGKTKSVFLPLCGKTNDILWMYQNGHTVCGVDIAEQPIQELFKENKIESEIKTLENVGKLYQSKDGRLKLFVADLLDVSPGLCGQYDVIWDRKAFVAINLADHEQYRDKVLSLMKEGGLYILSTFEFDPKVWPGPPHTMSEKAVRDLFGGPCFIELLKEIDRTGEDVHTPPGETPSFEAGLPEPVGPGPAIKTSSYLYDRWYKMFFKPK